MPKYTINNTDYTLEVRPIEPNDHVAITDLHRRCFKHNYITIDECLEFSKEKGFLLTVGLIDSMPVTYLLMHITRPSISIYAMAVHPEWQRIGVGTTMLNHAHRHAQGRKMPLEIEIHTDWIEAQQFVTARGMERAGSYTVFDSDGEYDKWYTYLKE